MAKKDVEYRYFDADATETRAVQEGDNHYLEGHAAIFNTRSKLIFENGKLFNEVISPDAFTEVLKDERIDVPFTLNHIRGQLLGRTKSKTLTLSVDERGLKFRVSIPNTTTGRDVLELVQRGDLFSNSFGFITNRASESWSKDEEGNNIRTINKVLRLVDVAVVTDAAYPDTDIALRSFEEFEAETKKEEIRLEPTPGEDKDEFISQCIKYVMDEGEANDEKQAAAICYSKWDNRSAKVNLDLEKMRMHIAELKLKIK